MIFEKHHYTEREIIVFIDESGDPTFRDPGNPLFLLGGCITSGAALDRDIREPWRAVREQILGNRDEPLHMRERARRMRDEHIEIARQFFRESPCKRVSLCVDAKTSFDIDGRAVDPVLEISMELFLRTAAELTFGDQYVDGFCIVFEEGPLVQRMRRFWPQRRLSRKDAVGVVSGVPVSWAVVSKESNEPGLEVADFISHTAAGHARPALQERFAARFNDVFPKDRADLMRCLTLNSVAQTGTDGAAKSGSN